MFAVVTWTNNMGGILIKWLLTVQHLGKKWHSELVSWSESESSMQDKLQILYYARGNIMFQRTNAHQSFFQSHGILAEGDNTLLLQTSLAWDDKCGVSLPKILDHHLFKPWELVNGSDSERPSPREPPLPPQPELMNWGEAAI